MRQCVICGKEFFHSKLRKTTCSKKCKDALWRKQNKEHHLEYNRRRDALRREELRQHYRENKEYYKEKNHQAYLRRKAKLAKKFEEQKNDALV